MFGDILQEELYSEVHSGRDLLHGPHQVLPAADEVLLIKLGKGGGGLTGVGSP